MTYHGSIWVCLRDTEAKPGESSNGNLPSKEAATPGRKGPLHDAG